MTDTTWKRADTDWFCRAKWGAFCHYTASAKISGEEWSQRVDAFDVAALARQLKSVGAGYFFITLGQASGRYLAPNEAYDRLVGLHPSGCSRRNLISDLSDALGEVGIPLLLYLHAAGPGHDPAAAAKLGWEWADDSPSPKNPDDHLLQRAIDFEIKHEAIITEWSQRFGRKVRGWLIDACFFARAMYVRDETPNFRTLAQALKAGNPDSIVAFNCDVKLPVASYSQYEDFTAGELDQQFEVGLRLPQPPYHAPLPQRWIDGAQFHTLTYIGPWWGSGPPRFPDELVIGYTKHINRHEGVVSWDVPIRPSGLIEESSLAQLAKLGEAIKRE